MCTVIHKQNWGHPLTADIDLTVYKNGAFNYKEEEEDENKPTSNFRSRYRGKVYTPDVVYIVEMKLTEDTSVSDTEEDNYRQTIPSGQRLYIGQGFHSYDTIDRARARGVHWKTIAEFIIPKGSLYYLNGSGNIVSNQIIFKKFI